MSKTLVRSEGIRSQTAHAWPCQHLTTYAMMRAVVGLPRARLAQALRVRARAASTNAGTPSSGQAAQVAGADASGAARTADADHSPNFMPRVEGGSLPYSIERELPNPLIGQRQQRLYFALFCAAMGVSLFGFFKYEAASSPIVSSTLYTLRRSRLAEDHLGEGIQFASAMPWISGSTGIAKKLVDFTYWVRGSRAVARVHFAAEKVPGHNRYRVLAWTITPEDGATVDLMNEEFHPHVPGPKEAPGMERAQPRL